MLKTISVTLDNDVVWQAREKAMGQRIKGLSALIRQLLEEYVGDSPVEDEPYDQEKDDSFIDGEVI